VSGPPVLARDPSWVPQSEIVTAPGEGGTLPPLDDVSPGGAAEDVLTAKAREGASSNGAPRDAAQVPAPADAPPARDEGADAPAAPKSEGERTVIVDPATLSALREEKAKAPASGKPLLGDVATYDPTQAMDSEDTAPSSVTGDSAIAEMLENIPDAETAAPPVVLPRVEMTAQATEAIARQYEQQLRRELQRKLAQNERSFLSRHFKKLIVATAVLVLGGVGGGVYLYIMSVKGAQFLADYLAKARNAVAKDTASSYRAALKGPLPDAVKLDKQNAEAFALQAYASAVLYAEHGQSTEDRMNALAAAANPKVPERFPGIALAVKALVAEPAAKEAARREVLQSKLTEPELQELAGRLLLERKDTRGAEERFTRALEASPERKNVRAWVAWAKSLRERQEYARAAELYLQAKAGSPQHPEAVVGLAECRDALGQQAEEALQDLEGLKDDGLDPQMLARKQLVEGRLLTEVGRADAAVKLLADGWKRHPTRSFDYHLAYGLAARGAGQMDVAQKAFEAALKERPKSEEAREGLGRVLIARDREREVLGRLPADADSKRVRLVRGIALAKLGDIPRARAELLASQLKEAGVYLARLDAAESLADKAQGWLEDSLKTAKKARATMQVALGDVLWQRGQVEKARGHFEEAMKDPLEYEAPCALGRLLVSLGRIDEAIAPLTQAMQRNPSHGEARDALGRVLLWRGRVDEALKVFEGWQADNPGNAAAQRGLGLALLRAGKLREADAVLARALRLDPRDPEAAMLRGLVQHARGDLRGGLASLERAAAKPGKKGALASCALGRTLLKEGKPDRAAKAFVGAKRDPAAADCAAIGAHAVRAAAPSKTAAKDLSELAQGARDVEDRVFASATLARVLLSTGALKEARVAAEAAVAAAPKSPAGHAALALVAFRQKDEAAAKDALLKEAELDAGDAGAQLLLGDLLSRSNNAKDLARASEAYGAYVRVAGNTPDAARARRAIAELRRKVR
jgi:tetratricopeptide (TPR) repeat protein